MEDVRKVVDSIKTAILSEIQEDARLMYYLTGELLRSSLCYKVIIIDPVLGTLICHVDDCIHSRLKCLNVSYDDNPTEFMEIVEFVKCIKDAFDI